MKKIKRAIDMAIEAAGTQANLARDLGIARTCVNRVFKTKAGQVPVTWCLKLNELYGLKPHALRPDIYQKAA